jgi:ribosomal protein S18 acetylase RimI-like enzyme
VFHLLEQEDPLKLEIATENSFVVCSAYASEKIVGFGRAISDGEYQSAIYDVVVLPEYQSKGVGKLIMESLLKRLPKQATTLVYVAPGKQVFYERQGFNHLKTGMGLFPDPENSKLNGYIF